MPSQAAQNQGSGGFRPLDSPYCSKSTSCRAQRLYSVKPSEAGGILVDYNGVVVGGVHLKSRGSIYWATAMAIRMLLGCE